MNLQSILSRPREKTNFAKQLTIEPVSGIYSGFQLVCLHGGVSSAGYYTTDGSDPRHSRTRLPIHYHEHLVVSAPIIVKAVRYCRVTGEFSQPVTARYKIRPIPTPRFNTVSADTVVLSNLPEDCTAYFAEDGSDPARSKNAIPWDDKNIIVGTSVKVAFAKICYCSLDEMQSEPFKIVWGPPAHPNTADYHRGPMGRILYDRTSENL